MKRRKKMKYILKKWEKIYTNREDYTLTPNIEIARKEISMETKIREATSIFIKIHEIC